jgi:hypothetical protein
MKSSNYMDGIIPGASITVYMTGTTTKATIYKDGSNTPLSNPFFSNLATGTNPGGFIFWAATNQGLDIQAQGGMGNASCTTSPLCYPTATTLQVDIYLNSSILPGCQGGNTIANGCTGATTAAGANLNITGVTQTGTLGTSSQVSTFPGVVAIGAADTALSRDSAGVIDVGNGAVGDTSGSIKLTNVTASGTVAAGTVIPTNGPNWQRMGTVLIPNVNEYIQEPTLVQPEGNCQILTTLATCWKMWFTVLISGEIGYAESPDGVVWTRYSTAVITTAGYRRPFVIKNSTTYHMYTALNDTQIDHFTSTDGVTWTLANSNVIPLGGVGSYDSVNVANSGGIIIGGTLYLFLEGNGSSGLYSIGEWQATDFHTFTAAATNPVISTISVGSMRGGPSTPYYLNGAWWIWVHGAPNGAGLLPTDLYRYTATSVTGPWTASPSGPIFTRMTQDEGASSANGQTADPYVMEVNGASYLFYSSSPDGGGACPYANATLQCGHIKLAVANMPMASLVQTAEGVAKSTGATQFPPPGANHLGTDSSGLFVVDPPPVYTNGITVSGTVSSNPAGSLTLQDTGENAYFQAISTNASVQASINFQGYTSSYGSPITYLSLTPTAATFADTVTAPSVDVNNPSGGAVITMHNGAGVDADAIQMFANNVQVWSVTTVVTSNNLGIYNVGGSGTGFNFYLQKSTGYLELGSSSGSPNPGSRLTVVNGDVYVPSIGSGVVLVDSGGACWRVKPAPTTGAFTSTSITCPTV